MKRLMLIIGILISLFPITIEAEQVRPHVYVRRSNPSIGMKPHRSPACLPEVVIVYDTDNHSLNISCSGEYDAIVKVYDENRELIVMSNIDDIIYMPSVESGILDIEIESDKWSAYANIVL